MAGTWLEHLVIVVPHVYVTTINYFLRVIPTNCHSVTIYLTYSFRGSIYNYFWHSIWHIFRHSMLHSLAFFLTFCHGWHSGNLSDTRLRINSAILSGLCSGACPWLRSLPRVPGSPCAERVSRGHRWWNLKTVTWCGILIVSFPLHDHQIWVSPGWWKRPPTLRAWHIWKRELCITMFDYHRLFRPWGCLIWMGDGFHCCSPIVHLQ